VMRGIFIAAGAAFVAHFDWAFYVFGALLLLSGVRLIFLSAKDLEDRRLFRFLRRHLPVTREYRGHRFMVRKDGALRATPLLVALILVEASDVVMALDSIPAIFAVTREPFLVYSAVVFSILGLRALYFVLQGMVDRFRYLQPAVAVVLILLGIKMIADDVVELPPWIALATTVVVVAGAVGLSLWRKPQRRARAEAA
jgi:tellurite resistance protein TerC